MDDDFYPMDISDSDDDESYEREPTYKVLSIEQVNQKMHQIVDGIESSTGVCKLFSTQPWSNLYQNS